MQLPTTPSSRLDGKRALVTGAGRGIGVACAAALAEAGAHVTLAARTASEIDNVAKAIREGGGRADALVLDVTDIESTRRIIGAQAPFDILINNAGTNKPMPFLDVTPENYDLITDLNVRAAFFVAQAVARGLRDAGKGGSFINMSSIAGHIAIAGRVVYITSKHAVEGLTKSLALDLAPMKIRVNAIAPTFIVTEMTKSYFENVDFLNATLAKISLKRLGQVEDLMGAVVYLASDASGFMTGASLRIDGGWAG